MENKKGMNLLMATIDSVLENIIWMNPKSELVTLKSMLYRVNGGDKMSSIENMSREDLVGAFTCLQIRHELFGETIENCSNKEVSDKIKDIIFEETKEKLVNLGITDNSNVYANQKIA